MLPEALAALATAGGTAVIQAAGTEAWEGMRQRVAVWFGRGDESRTADELARLDRTASELASAEDAQRERLQIRQEAGWQARFEAQLENLDEAEREQAVAELRELVKPSDAANVSAGAGGQAIGGDLHVSAEGGSIAAGVIQGGAQIGHPSPPDQSRG